MVVTFGKNLLDRYLIPSLSFALTLANLNNSLAASYLNKWVSLVKLRLVISFIRGALL